MISATPMTIATETSADREVSACAPTLGLAIGMDWKRSKMPPRRSRNSRYAVYATPDAMGISKMPGSV